MYPNLFVIGAAKSGTTSLHYYLDQHPQVHMSREKEPNFFSHQDDPQRPNHVVSDPGRYQRLFETDLPVRGEASVSYSFFPYPAGVPGRIHAVAPDARFIYLVRDPVDRAISHYRHRVVLGEETRSIHEVIAAPDEPTERYVTASSYATQAEQYLALFPQDRLLVLEQAELMGDRATALRRCFTFLGVDADFSSPSWSRRLNETDSQRRYSPMADRIRHSAPYRRTIGWLSPELRATLLRPVRRALTDEVVVPDEFGDDVRSYFAERLQGEAQRFRALTGLPFPDWSV